MYYAVKSGHKTGVFDNWTDAQAAISGFSNADYKKFRSFDEANAYLCGRDIWKEKVEEDNSKGLLVAFTDGSYEQTLNRYSYGVVFILPSGEEKCICGYGSNKEYIESNNIIGELFGVINAFDWAISNGYEKIKIYHDYAGLSKWISGEWDAKAKVSQMYVRLFKAKFDGFLQVEFEKVPGHTNVCYNEKADQLAKTALVDRKKVAIQGEHWFSIPYFCKNDFDAFAEIIIESDASITFTVDNQPHKSIYKFKLNSDSVTVSLFKSGEHKLLVQGKNTYLFQVITTTLVELDDSIKIDQILGSAYRVTIEKTVIDKGYLPIERGLPKDYPPSVKRLLKQAVINLNYYVESEDYSQYAFPALKALEGHIKYLINLAGGSVGRAFTCFGLDKTASPNKFYLTERFPDTSKNPAIETCYNYYNSQRNTAFHFGDVFNSTNDNTRIISDKAEADEIIKKCINLIETQQ
ncbi:MAG: type II toxin-antitoxin system RnlA family toxin [Oscillospiraceae bacterium]|nr:type II toxin-antitoxin system RnlA family toxin [Oscillospiraceae bacterium]